MMKNKKKRSYCPVSQSLDVWGDKWSLLIIRDLIMNSTCTYGDFQKSEEKISTNILANRLQMLEENGVISKQNHPENKTKVLYSLTQKGIDLFPVLLEINLWAAKYYDIPEERREMLNEVKKDKENYITKIMKALSKGSNKFT